MCPGKQELTYRFSTVELDRELKYYRASGGKSCPLRSRCTRNKNNRTLTREANEHLMAAMAERMQQQPEKYAQRKRLRCPIPASKPKTARSPYA